MFLLFGRELQTTLHDPNSQISRTLDVLRTAVRPVCRQPVQNFSLGMSKRGATDQHGRDYHRYTLPHRGLSYLYGSPLLHLMPCRGRKPVRRRVWSLECHIRVLTSCAPEARKMVQLSLYAVREDPRRRPARAL